MALPGPAELLVSRYVDTDAPQVVGFLADCAARDSTLEILSYDRWCAYTRLSFNRGAKDFAVARKRARMVGILTSTLLATTNPPLRHFRIVVHPDERRRGIGSFLLHRVQRQDPAHDVVLQCNCRRSWGAGREFLKRSSFRVARRHVDMVLRDPSLASFPLPGKCVIRPYRDTVPDAADWLRLDHEGYADDPDAQRPTKDDLETRRTEPGFRMWMMKCEGAAIGFLHATGGVHASIRSLVVTPAWRGRGFARALMCHAIRALRSEGSMAFKLGVREENSPALGLYRSLGFEITEEVETWQRSAPASHGGGR